MGSAVAAIAFGYLVWVMGGQIRLSAAQLGMFETMCRAKGLDLQWHAPDAADPDSEKAFVFSFYRRQDE